MTNSEWAAETDRGGRDVVQCPHRHADIRQQACRALSGLHLSRYPLWRKKKKKETRTQSHMDARALSAEQTTSSQESQTEDRMRAWRWRERDETGEDVHDFTGCICKHTANCALHLGFYTFNATVLFRQKESAPLKSKPKHTDEYVIKVSVLSWIITPLCVA